MKVVHDKRSNLPRTAAITTPAKAAWIVGAARSRRPNLSARSRARRTQQRARRAGLRQRAGGAAAARSTARAFSDRRDGG